MSTDLVVGTSDPIANPIAPPPLPGDLAVCHAMIVELLDALKKSQHECDGLQQRLDQLLRRLYGPKAERFDPNQPWLLPELATANADPNGTTARRGDQRTAGLPAGQPVRPAARAFQVRLHEVS